MNSDPIAGINDFPQYVHGCIVIYRIQLIKDYKTIQSPKESHYIYQSIQLTVTDTELVYVVILGITPLSLQVVMCCTLLLTYRPV
jgi:hypothetical protein